MYVGWKILQGLSTLPLITGHEMKLILQVLDILIEGLVEGDEGDDVIFFLQKYNEWYIALTAPEFCCEELAELCRLGDEVATLYLASPLIHYSKVDLRTKKFHHMMCHAIDTIRAYGCLLNTNTSLWEGFHRCLKKISRRKGSTSALLWIAEKQALCQALDTVYVNLNKSGVAGAAVVDEDKVHKIVRPLTVHQNRFAGS